VGGRLKISSIKSVTKSPPTPNPSPPRAARVGGRGKANSFSRRMRARAMPTARKLLPSQTKKGGGAPIGARSWGRVLRTRQRALAQSPLASRRSTAALTKVISLGSTPGRASWNYRVQTGGPPGASAASTSRTGPNAGRFDARSRPSAGLRSPPAGTALAVSGSSLETPFTSEMDVCNHIGDECQWGGDSIICPLPWWERVLRERLRAKLVRGRSAELQGPLTRPVARIRSQRHKGRGIELTRHRRT
jgi:hypothetical protein